MQAFRPAVSGRPEGLRYIRDFLTLFLCSTQESTADAVRLFERVHLAELQRPAGHPPFHQLVQHYRLRLVDFEKHRRLNIHANQDESRIVFRPMPRIAVVGKPDLPIRRIQLRDLPPIARQGSEEPTTSKNVPR